MPSNYFVNVGTITDAQVEYQKEFTSKAGKIWEDDIVITLKIDVEELDFDVDLSIRGSYVKDKEDIVTSRGSAFKPLQAVRACGIELEFEDVDGKTVKDFKKNKVHYSKAGFPKDITKDMIGKEISYISYKTDYTSKSGNPVYFKYDYICPADKTDFLERNFNQSVKDGFVKQFVGA